MVDLLRKRREKRADSGQLRELADELPGPDELWEVQWKNQHLKYCVEQVRGSMPQAQFEAFEMLVLKGAAVEEVCEHLGMNSNQVYKAKSRMLRKVRAKMVGIGYSEAKF